MQQTIIVKDLRVNCILGVFPHERENTQDVFVDVYLMGDWSNSFTSDDIADTLDYDSLSAELICMLQTNQYQLLEKAAHDLAQFCLGQPVVSTVKVKIKKTHAISAAKYTAFEILLP